MTDAQIMTGPHALENKTPWYREPWPWILMSGPAVAVVAGFVTLYLAVVGADALVVDNYYKEGLAINRMLDRDRAALEQGYRAVVMISPARTRARIQLTGEGVLPRELRLRFVHPTKGGMDLEVVARQTQPGWYEAGLALAPAARWDVQIEDAGQQWRLTGDWYASDASFVLQPRRD
jgi:uncharacterized protein